jgi:hypothetical protein
VRDVVKAEFFPRRVLQKLLLPGINLVRMNLVAHRQLVTVACSRSASSAIFAFSAASIFRLGFFIIRSVYHDGAGFVPIKPMVPKSGSSSLQPRRSSGLAIHFNRATGRTRSHAA